MTGWPLLFSLALASVIPVTARAQTPADVVRARRSTAHEPLVQEVSSRALDHFRVDPARFDRLRRSARTRGLLPILAAGWRLDDDNFARNEDQGPMPLNAVETTNRQINSVNVGALWDLRQLAFNPAEVQVYGLVGVQRDILLEVTRTYFLRRQLQLRLALRPPTEPLAQAALELRIQEFTAILDVMTGGWFSREAMRRYEAR